MKTIGVIGGLGPQATMDFEARLHRLARERLPARFNSGYPPLVVYYHRKPPFLLDADGVPLTPIQADPSLLEAAARLGAMADFLVIPSNSPHLLQEEIERASGREVLSMIDLALEEIGRRGWKRIGLLGMGEPRVYIRRLERSGLGFEVLAPEDRRRLDAAIGTLMEGREDDTHRAEARRAVGEMRARGVDGTVLGCTEIPLLLGGDADAPDLLSPLPLLAEATLRRALE